MIPERLSGSASRRLRLPIAVAAVALAVFAARLVEQRTSVRTALAEGEDAFRRGDFARAADRFHTALEIDPGSTATQVRLAAAFAGMSDASLAQASGVVLDAEARAGLLPASGHPIADDELRRSLADRWSASIADGIDAASKAVTLDREHERAMLALEGWHQLAADLAASSDEYRRQMISADEWRQKALAVRRLKVERGERGSQ